MTNVDDLKELLRQKADEIDLQPAIPPPVLRRARRHRLFNASLAGGLAVLIAVAGFAGARSLDRDAPVTPGTPTPSQPLPTIGGALEPWRGIWPQTTRSAAEVAQAQADAGNADFTWQLSYAEVAERYATEVLGWTPTTFTVVGPPLAATSPRPPQVIVYSCDPSPREPCNDPDPSKVTLTLEPLLRDDKTGLWFVTALAGPEPMRLSSPEPRDTATPGNMPATFVAVSQAPEGSEPVGTLVLVDSTTGEVVSTLLDFVDLSEGVGPPAVSPDGTTVYMDQGTSACGSDIVRVPTGGGQTAKIASGSNPEISPDGSLLAYIDSYYTCQPDLHLVVRNLATGEEAKWALGHPPVLPKAGFYGVCAMAWFPDSVRLAFNFCYEWGNVPYILDTEQDVGIHLKDAPQVPVGQGTSTTIYGVDGETGDILAEQSCCGLEPTQRALISIDAQTGETVEVLIEPSRISSGGFDVTGQYLIYVEDHAVFRWDGSGSPSKVADRYVTVAW